MLSLSPLRPLPRFGKPLRFDSGQNSRRLGKHISLDRARGRLLGLIAALLFARNVLGNETGTPEMRAISDAIREGAEAFMKRQYSTIAMLAVRLAVVLFAGYYVSRPIHRSVGEQGRDQLHHRRGLLGAGRLQRHVRLDPRQYPSRRGGAHEHRKGAARSRCAAAR